MTLKIRAIGRARKYASGGYLSRLSPAPDGGGALSSPLAFVPPVTLKFQEVERALPPALDLVPIALKKESSEAAAAQAKEMTDGLSKAIAENKHWTKAQRDEYTSRVKSLEKDIEHRLVDDPMHFANRMNLKRLQSDITTALNDPDMGAWNSQAEARKNMANIHTQSGTLSDLYQDEQGRPKLVNGRYLTNKEYVELYGSRGASDAEYRQAYGASDDNRLGEFASNNRTGTLKQAAEELRQTLAMAGKNGYRSATEKYQQGDVQQWDEMNKYVMKIGKSSGWTDNQVQVETAKRLMAKDWRNNMSAEARHGLEQNAWRAWLDEKWNAKENPGNLTNRQALELSARNPQLASWLDEDREAFTQKFGEDYVGDFLEIGKARSSESTYTEADRGLTNPPTTTRTNSDGEEIPPLGTAEPVDTFTEVVHDTPGYDQNHNTNLYIAYRSNMQPGAKGDVVEQPISTMGRHTYVLQDGAWYARNTANNKVKRLPQILQSVKGVDGEPDNPLMEVANQTVPVLLEVRDNDGRIVTGKGAKNDIVTVGTANTSLVKVGRLSAPVREANGRQYFEDAEGNKFYFQNVSGTIYQQGSGKEALTTFIVDNREESILKYGTNLSMEKARQDYLQGDGRPNKTEEPYKQLQASMALPSVQADFEQMKQGKAPTSPSGQLSAMLFEIWLTEKFLSRDTSEISSFIQDAGMYQALRLPFSNRQLNPSTAKAFYNEKMEEIATSLTRQKQENTVPRGKIIHTPSPSERQRDQRR